MILNISDLICYIDPASTAIIWQIAVGIFVAFGIVLGVWWTKISTFVKGLWVKISGRGRENSDTLKQKNAIILAAGMGARMIPLTYDMPKSLVKVNGEPLIERHIQQLIEAGINDIVVVTGYKKETLNYLTEKYNVKLVFNPEYDKKNNLTSLYCVSEYLGNTYIIEADTYCQDNIYMDNSEDSFVACTYRKDEINVNEICITNEEDGFIKEMRLQNNGKDIWVAEGVLYFNYETSKKFKKSLEKYKNHDCYFWYAIEKSLDILPPISIVDITNKIGDFNTLEELREFDISYKNCDNLYLNTICKVFNCKQTDITNMENVNVGMCNKHFTFDIDNTKYFLRISGEGMSEMANRVVEKAGYEALKSLKITDEVVYFDTDTGIKITSFIHNCKNADPNNDDELKISMEMLYKFHSNNIKLESNFDIETKTECFVKLAKKLNAIRFEDFEQTYSNIKQLYQLKKELNIPEYLCHGDYAHINVLILPDKTAKIIDLEFCGNGDPIMDVAMYGIFAYFNKERLDKSLELYLGRKPVQQEIKRFYMYVALSAFLWVGWSEVKQAYGSDFGDYTQKMYDYTKQYLDLCLSI